MSRQKTKRKDSRRKQIWLHVIRDTELSFRNFLKEKKIVQEFNFNKDPGQGQIRETNSDAEKQIRFQNHICFKSPLA